MPRKRSALKRLKFYTFLILFLTILFLFRNVIVRFGVAQVSSLIIGAPVSIEQLELYPAQQEIFAKGLIIKNPKGFPNDALISIAEAGLKFNGMALFWGKLHFYDLSLDIEQVTIHEDLEGITNVDSLGLIKRIKQKSEAKKKFRPLRTKIDLLRLNINKIIEIKEREGKEPLVKVYENPVKNKGYRDIRSLQQVVVLVISHAITKASIKAVGIRMAAAYLGINSLPISAVSMLIKKDNSAGEWNISVHEAREKVLSVVSRNGALISDNEKGQIKAKIHGASITIKIKRKEDATQIRVYARKFFLSRRELAAGILHKIAKEIDEN